MSLSQGCVSRVIASFLILISFLIAPSASYAQVGVSVSFNLFAPPPVALAPPPIPVYLVPPPPTVGYVWTPGHWRWGYAGYFWVPGTWVQPPAVGVLWTPGYWGWRDGVFVWNEGYWGPHVGFYGGINYGGGYGGIGFIGGGWHGGVYNVNRSVINVTNVTNNHTTGNTLSVNASFSGGPGGTTATPTPAEDAAAHESHMALTQMQVQHAQTASNNPALALSVNHGKPSIAATSRAGDFEHGAIGAQRAGVPNHQAQQHNAQVRQNPELAHGGAMPRNNRQQNQRQRNPGSYQQPHPEEDGAPRREPAEERGRPEGGNERDH